MSLVTKSRRRRSTNIVMGSIIRNHLKYLEDKEDVHPTHRPQRASLITKKTSIKVPVKYANFVDIFSSDLVFELSEHN